MLYITLGRKKSGGYAVSVRDVLISCAPYDDSKVSIVLKLDEPAPGEGVDLGETSPFVIAKIQLTCLKNISYSQFQFIQKYNSQYAPVDRQILQFRYLGSE